MQIAHLPYITTCVLVLLVSSDRSLDTLTSARKNAFEVTPSPWASLIHTHWHKKIIGSASLSYPYFQEAPVQKESISMALHHANWQWTSQPLLSLTSN